jgi:hypothetical protein
VVEPDTTADDAFEAGFVERPELGVDSPESGVLSPESEVESQEGGENNLTLSPLDKMEDVKWKTEDVKEAVENGLTLSPLAGSGSGETGSSALQTPAFAEATAGENAIGEKAKSKKGPSVESPFNDNTILTLSSLRRESRVESQESRVTVAL